LAREKAKAARRKLQKRSESCKRGEKKKKKELM
jgi:hypothetical protein